ncbi:hypothetical protein PRZ48_014750 [Zasmidium cellare]|uniref:Uncharacterized protein n=1 Tax=Zasmidium cellare TaxID=395010 RepID=A0ABR0DZ64_ZASCE|nr:hypothetical protein PRZ48_014750 [Zasmidium cellare]
MDRVTLIEGPAFEAKLSPLDAKFAGLYSRRLLTFKPAVMDKELLAKVLEQATESLLEQLPILGGVVDMDKSPPGGQSGWKSIEPGPGVEITVKDVSDTLDFEGLEKQAFPPASLPDAMLMPVDGNLAQVPYPACKLQLNLTDAGALLAVCVAHNVSDGPGISAIVCLLAECCRKVQQNGLDAGRVEIAPELRVGLDRTCYRGLKGSKNRIEDQPAYRMVPKEEQKSKPSKPDIIVKMYRIPSDRLKALKSATTTIRISTHDAISALIWRSITINRIAAGSIKDDSTAPSTFFIPVNTRRHMSLDPNFIGNAVFQTRCTLTIGALLSENGLAQAAAAIRTAINAVSADSIAGHIDLLERQESLQDVQWIGSTARGPNDVASTSFYHSEAMYAADFGGAFGHRMLCMRPTELGFLGNVSVMHYVMPFEGERGCEVQLSVERGGLEEMEGDGVFGRFFCDVAAVGE